MRIDVTLLGTGRKAIDRVPYLHTGVILMLIKFGLDWTLATRAFRRPWSAYSYLVFPDYAALTVFNLPRTDQFFSFTLLLVSLPFIWIGVILTVHRLRAAELPIALVALFFVPVVNLFLFLVLIVVPTRLPLVLEAPPTTEWARLRLPRGKPREVGGGDRTVTSGVRAIAFSVPVSVGFVVLGANQLQSYGFGIFVGAPFFLGLLSVVLFGLPRPQSLGGCIIVAMTATTLAGLGIFLIAMEGFICLVMAAPIAYFLSFLGAMVGYAIQARPWLSDQTPTLCLGLLVLLPSIMAAEAAQQPELGLREIQTEVVIDAPPERVWQHVIAFSPLPEPTDWLFQTGIAYPQRAEIHGSGVGAVRHCVFSTGAFVEPIDVWDPPRLLCFRVTEQPATMKEWSPYDIHPPHLDHHLVSQRGQFRLEALPGGRTRLVGTTWYTNRMWPGLYWNLWSDYIIHRIHLRVLEHIRDLATTP